MNYPLCRDLGAITRQRSRVPHHPHSSGLTPIEASDWAVPHRRAWFESPVSPSHACRLYSWRWKRRHQLYFMLGCTKKVLTCRQMQEMSHLLHSQVQPRNPIILWRMWIDNSACNEIQLRKALYRHGQIVHFGNDARFWRVRHRKLDIAKVWRPICGDQILACQIILIP